MEQVTRWPFQATAQVDMQGALLVCRCWLTGFCLAKMMDGREGQITVWLGVQVWQKA